MQRHIAPLVIALAHLSVLGCSDASPSWSAPSDTVGASEPQNGGTGGGALAGLGGSDNVSGEQHGGSGASSGGGGTGGQATNPYLGASVVERNGDAARSGHFMRSALTHAAAKQFFFEVGFESTFQGDVKTSPLYLEKGPGGRNTVFVVTTRNDVLALDATSGAVVWSTHLGDSPTTGSVACSGASGFGVLGTPVIDVVGRTLYVAAGVGQPTLARHEIHALAVDDGQERPGFPLDVAKLSTGFVAAEQYQRSALSLVGGFLYVAYGGAPGCKEYRGWVFAIQTSNPTVFAAWSSRSPGGGVDAAAGMPSDGSSLFVATGAGAIDNMVGRQDSQELLRLKGQALTGSGDQDVFVAPDWQAMNQSGASLGASNPLLVDVPGATPASYVASVSSNGHLYLRDRQNLGAVGGVDFVLASGSPTAIQTAPTTYRTAKGTYLALTAARGVTCPGNLAPPSGNTGQVLVAIRLEPGTPATPKMAWCYYMVNGAQGAPVSTSTDGTTDATVWFMDDQNRKLLGLDGDTGEVLFNGGHDISNLPFERRTCPGVADGVSPIAIDRRVLIAGSGRLCAWCATATPGGPCLQ